MRFRFLDVEQIGFIKCNLDQNPLSKRINWRGLALPRRGAHRLTAGGLDGPKLSLTFALVLLVLQTPGSAGPMPQAPEQVFLGVSLLKTEVGSVVRWAVEPVPRCPGCRLVLDRFASGENAREVYFHLWAPAGQTEVGPIRVRIDPAQVRGVLVGRTDYQMPSRGWAPSAPRADGPASVPFRRDGGSIIFEAPCHPHGFDLPPDDLGDVTQRYTYIETPGVYIRIAHADPRRRAGRYADGPWPAVQAQAALNLEFATQEAIDVLGLVPSARRQGAKTIMLMNFDTNYPTLGPGQAHEDWPPHWHMHLYWQATPKVRKVDHFYITSSGLLGRNLSDDLQAGSQTKRVQTWLDPGQVDATFDADHRVVYTQSITKAGWFKLSSKAGTCLFRPTHRSYASGVAVECGKYMRRVRAGDDLRTHQITLKVTGKNTMRYYYDPDTGQLLKTAASQN